MSDIFLATALPNLDKRLGESVDTAQDQQMLPSSFRAMEHESKAARCQSARERKLFILTSSTLPGTNIAPENWWLGDYIAFGKAYFQGLLSRNLTL